MATRQGVSRKTPPNREGGHFGLRATSAWIARQGPPVDFTSTHLRSPSTHPHSGWGVGKSGVGGGEWKVSSPGFLFCLDAKTSIGG
jgi:hypothetical protein